MTGTPRRTTGGTCAGTSGARRRKRGTNSERTRARRSRARRMHRPTLAGTQRRTRRAWSSPGHGRTALKNWLTGHWTTGRGARAADGNSRAGSAEVGRSRLHWRRSRPHWGFVYGTRSSLGNDHAGRGRSRGSLSHGRWCRWRRAGRNCWRRGGNWSLRRRRLGQRRRRKRARGWNTNRS